MKRFLFFALLLLSVISLPAPTVQVAGSATVGYIPVWLNGSSVTRTSMVYQSGAFVGIGTTTPASVIEIMTGTNYVLRFNGVGLGGATGTNYENMTLGWQAGQSLLATNGYANTLIGKDAGRVLAAAEPNAHANTIVGYGSAILLTNGSYNTMIGVANGSMLTSQSGNTLIGYHAGSNLKSIDNTYVGIRTGRGHATLATGTPNAAFGADCMASYTTAAFTAGFGYSALETLTSGNNNTAFGSLALRNITTGTQNIGVGYGAGDNLTTGGTNIYIGYNIDASSVTATNELIIGNLIYGKSIDGTGTTVSTGNIGIGFAVPTARLNVRGYGATSATIGFLVEDSAGVDLLEVRNDGRISVPTTITAGGTTTTQTIDKPSGRVNIAAAQTTVTVNNALCTANSLVFVTVATNDGTATIKNAVSGAGSFVITLTAAATAETKLNFLIINP